MNGATSLVRSLIASGIDVCFANPGTSEMHFVAALDQVGGMRCVLGLHETVVTGAADGYARMAGKPAATLLHTGPGLANGVSNLHNAKKAHTPVVNIVGEHALWHIEHDAPLTSDIQAIAAPVSHWVKTSTSAADLGVDGAAAVAAACTFPGQIATLILPANTAWEALPDQPNDVVEAVGDSGNSRQAAAVPEQRIAEAAELLRQGKRVCFILGGRCLMADALEWVDRVAQQCQATVLGETFKARLQRGVGRVSVMAVPYAIDQAIELLKPFDCLITVCAKPPVGFFAYPDKPSKLYREDAIVHCLAGIHEDGPQAIRDLAGLLGADELPPRLQSRQVPDQPASGVLTSDAISDVVARLMPADAIVMNESITSGRTAAARTAGSNAHDWLEICGGSIGGGFPIATGAAIASPGRKVIALQADGSGMYSLQALWTQARERLNITTIIYANRSYAILKHELDNVQATSGRTAHDMMELDRPELDWVALATGMGVSAVRATTVDEFTQALKSALADQGPRLIEALIDA